MSDFDQLLDQYQALRKEVFAYFGYNEDWRVIPLEDSRDYFWRLELAHNGVGGKVCYAESEDELSDEGGEDGNYYENEIFTCCHLPKHVYRGPDHTMVVVDTRTDGNKFLQVFSNAKERPQNWVENNLSNVKGLYPRSPSPSVYWVGPIHQERADA
jgi:hypothetical protein